MQLVTSFHISLRHLQGVNAFLHQMKGELYRIARKFIVNSVGHAGQQPKQAEDKAEDKTK